VGRRGRQAKAPDAVPEDGKTGDRRPEVTSVTVDVVVMGRRRPVTMLQRRGVSAFQLREGRVLVTVLARHLGPQFPDIVRMSDLGPMLFGAGAPDEEAIAAAFAERRRQHD